MNTIRCRCGYVLNLPSNMLEAMNQTCPGCGSTMDYLFNEKENEARITQELGTAIKRTYIPPAFWGLFWPVAWITFFFTQPTSREMLGWQSAGVLTYIFIVLFLLIMPPLSWLFGISISSLFFTLFTKKMYVEDRVAFTRAGGLDLALWTPVACALLTAAYYWATWKGLVEIPIWRNPFGFLMVWLAVLVVCEIVLAWILFKVMRPKFGKRSW